MLVSALPIKPEALKSALVMTTFTVKATPLLGLSSIFRWCLSTYEDCTADQSPSFIHLSTIIEKYSGSYNYFFYSERIPSHPYHTPYNLLLGSIFAYIWLDMNMYLRNIMHYLQLIFYMRGDIMSPGQI